jgi:hypothetical protein
MGQVVNIKEHGKKAILLRMELVNHELTLGYSDPKK